MALARTENLLEKLDGFSVRAAGAEVPWAQARPPLLAAADERARAAHRPLLAREGGKTYEEKVAAARENPTPPKFRPARRAVGEPRGFHAESGGVD